MRLLITFLFLLCSITAGAKPADILTVYQWAETSDPELQAAKARQLAASETLPQAIALLLPTLNSTANTRGIQSELLGNHNTYFYTLELNHETFNVRNWQTFRKARQDVRAATATYNAAVQDLIIRVANQYFNILAAQDDLEFARSSRIAFSRFLEQTQQRFKVGLIAITDVHEAQARRDNAYANEIAAKNALENEYEVLRTLVGRKVNSIAVLRKTFSLKEPTPNNIEQWVETAKQGNFTQLALRYSLNAAKREIDIQRSGHFPTVNFSADALRSKNPPPSYFRSKDERLTLTLNVPIFQGGGVVSRTRQAIYDYERLDREYEDSLRNLMSDTRQAFRTVSTLISQVKALKQAVVSNESSLKAIKAAFDVGTRTSVDVLNAQSELLAAERDYKKARYDYILQGLRLKQNAGTLHSDDILQVNGLIQT